MGNKRKSAFAINVRKRRKALGYKSVKDFAEFARIPNGTLRDIEAGYSDGWRDTREAIAKALGCTVDDLNVPPDATESNPKLSDLAGKQDKILALLERQEAASNEHSEEIQHLIQCWKDAPDERNRAVFLYFLTGDDRELDRAGKAFRKEAEAYFRHLGLKKTKGRASSL